MKIQMEIGDQIQYLAKEYNDNTIRFLIRYPERIKVDLLEKAVKSIVQRVEILHSSFYVNSFGIKWIVNQEYPKNELLVAENIDGDVWEHAQKVSLQAINYGGEIQLKCFLFQNATESAFVVLVGHMCCDGRDAVYLVKKIIELYNQLLTEENTEAVKIKSGSRLLNQCYNGDKEMLTFDLNQIKREKSEEIKSCYQFVSAEKGKACLIMHRLSSDDIARCRKFVEHATVNDVILAAYFRAYVKRMNLSNYNPVGIASMMDLRRYIEGGDSAGVTNMSGPININLFDGIGDDFGETLKRVVEQTKASKENEKAGLEFTLAVRKIFKIMPFPVITVIGKKIYRNMSIGLTNIGNLKNSELKMGDALPETLCFAGPVKKKPALQICASGLDGEVCLSIASECTIEDKKQLKELLDMITLEIKGIA